jgi:hypothetical protein
MNAIDVCAICHQPFGPHDEIVANARNNKATIWVHRRPCLLTLQAAGRLAATPTRWA